MTVAAAASVVVSALMFGGLLPAQAATTDPEPSALEKADATLSRSAAEQGMVLMENHDRALPIASSGNVALYGVGAYVTVKGGTGSGAVNNRVTVTARQGLENAGYKVTTGSAYWSAMTSSYDTKYGNAGSGGIFGPTIDYSSVEQRLTADTVQPTADTDTAVYVIARNSGEGSDRTSGKGDYQLADTERANLELLGRTYKHVVVVINSGGVIDTSFYQQINKAEKDSSGGLALDSMLLMSQAGQESGNALVNVLNGTVTPSGKLTDTWAASYSAYPASATFANNDGNSTTEEYSEGIYVGYRYFDSFYKRLGSDPSATVNYPFGYGASYTDFDIRAQQVTANAKQVKVTAKVTNTGKRYSGSEVVQVYVSAPQTGLDKAYQQLAGYVKTDNLAPGASQTVTVSFDTTSLASYDESRAAYVLDAGDYVVRVGNSSRNTHVAARLNLAKRVVTEQNHTELDDQKPASELSSDPADFYSYAGEKKEIAHAKRITLNPKSFRTEDKASPHEQDVAVDSSSPYYALDGAKISSTTAYLDKNQKNWENTGAPYKAKTGEKIEYVKTGSTNTLYDVAQGKVSVEQFVAGLSVTQLATIVEGSGLGGTTPSAVGAAGYTTGAYENLGIPSMALADGPAGLRLTQKIATTPASYQYATAFPIGTLLAQTWDRDLVKKVGTAIGKEMTAYGVQLWLAPGMNIHRDPLNGRNFEYYSEDPLLSGLTAAATTEGVQSNPGAGVTIKHLAGNNQETSRSGGNDVVGERAFREIELKGFEITVKAAQPMAVMSSYNKINNTYASGTYDLLTDLLRGEWGFKGTVMTDWGGAHGATNTMYSGNDLIEPGGKPSDIVNATIKTAPVVDLNGLPAYMKTVKTTGNPSYTFQLGALTLAAGGTATVSTTVDSKTDLSKTPLSGTTTVDAINNQTYTANAKFTSVDDAYRSVQTLLASTALTAAQKAAITVSDVQYATPGDAATPVVGYKVSLAGSYPADTSYTMRLGDLQRSAIRILTTASKSSSFQQLATKQKVKGISVGSYTEQFKNLDPVVQSSKNRVQEPHRGH
ncbi:glycoside hydrolase family 3 protein [Streptomyces sp. VRA16 Mangrove soil]|uniref:beta-glucosidase n=1 Tax=Streptomyces sp. VRA16 Mangrove soil TaxID=2817434 RepID=UPI001A9D4F27|nr:glycoside hydrolase family 3 N-terminal domain-containing protein [Streptomyces sp. VRA16 Mangrove soil]MBO1330461.1 glycoside hydrolase family 3 C-terminal domain-containing protein [Streptomyces sp. VRA16 Mangrove soil]